MTYENHDEKVARYVSEAAEPPRSSEEPHHFGTVIANVVFHALISLEMYRSLFGVLRMHNIDASDVVVKGGLPAQVQHSRPAGEVAPSQLRLLESGYFRVKLLWTRRRDLAQEREVQ